MHIKVLCISSWAEIREAVLAEASKYNWFILAWGFGLLFLLSMLVSRATRYVVKVFPRKWVIVCLGCIVVTLGNLLQILTQSYSYEPAICPGPTYLVHLSSLSNLIQADTEEQLGWPQVPMCLTSVALEGGPGAAVCASEAASMGSHVSYPACLQRWSIEVGPMLSEKLCCCCSDAK